MFRFPFAASAKADSMHGASVFNRTKSSVAKTMSAPLTLIRKSQIFENKYARRVAFEAMAPNTFVVSNCEKESFLVCTSDQTIGRYTYARKKPWDIDKLKTVVESMPQHNSRTTMIDIGANIGTICISAIKRGWFRKAIAVEPDPLNYSLLMSNIYLNGLQDDIRAHNMALGAADGEKLTLDRSSSNFGDRRIVTGAGAASGEVAQVASNTFDTIVGAAAPDSALIWMDVQGFEGFVLSGARAALAAKHPLCVEFWPFGLMNAGCDRQFKDAILGSGYREFVRLDGKTRKSPLTPASLAQLWASVGVDEDAFADLLFL